MPRTRPFEQHVQQYERWFERHRRARCKITIVFYINSLQNSWLGNLNDFLKQCGALSVSRKGSLSLVSTLFIAFKSHTVI